MERLANPTNSIPTIHMEPPSDRIANPRENVTATVDPKIDSPTRRVDIVSANANKKLVKTTLSQKSI